jgi:hypothetical protein
MGGWLEGAEAELDGARVLLESLAEEVQARPTEAQLRGIWTCYLSVEKIVAFVKLELEEESPGRFVDKKAYTVPDEGQALTIAARSLGVGTAALKAGNLHDGLNALRESRNYLRMLLRKERLASRGPRPRD